MGRLRSGVGALVAIILVGCAGAPAPRAETATPSASVVIPVAPRSTCDPSGSAAPLILSLAPERRSELETLMRQQIVTVLYECDQLVPLPDCTAEGSYSYVSVTPREQVMSLSSALEVQANLPLEGAALLDRVSPELAKGNRLDIASAIVGQQTSVLHGLQRSQLKGQCAKVTHFVRGASLGAFALALAHGAPESINDVFGGSSKLLQRDGSLEACRKLGKDDERVPGCAAPLRLELRPVTDDAPPASEPSAGDEAQASPQCPPNMHSDDQGKCTQSTSSAPYVCSFADHADCEKQCQAGSPGSCSLLARNYELGRGVKMDLVRAEQLYNLACRGGSPPGCGRLGALLVQRPATRDEGFELLRKSCKAGFFEACSVVNPSLTKSEAAALARRGCDGGNAQSCWGLGQLYREGVGVGAKDDAQAARYLKIACDSGTPLGCVSYTRIIDPGEAATPETPRALEILRTACERRNPAACSALGNYYGYGKGVPRDFDKSMALIEAACVGGDFSSCLATGLSYQKGLGHPKDLLKAQQFLTRGCEAGERMACAASERLRQELAPGPEPKPR